MANFSFDGFVSISHAMKKIESLPSSLLSDIVEKQAEILVEAQEKKARAYGIVDTGKTIESVTSKISSKIGVGAQAVISFKGTRRRGKTTTRNAEIAFVNEYGKRGQPARPFVRDAMTESAAKMEKAALELINGWLKENNL